MTDGGDRVAGRPAGDSGPGEAPGPLDAPLADLTADGPAPLADLAPRGAGVPEADAPLVDLSGPTTTPRRGDVAVDGDEATEHDDWAPLAPLATDGDPGASAPDPSPVTDAEADWLPLPGLAPGRRTPKGRGRRAGRPAARAADEPRAPAGEPELFPAAAAPAALDDGLPPGALGAGASGMPIGAPKRDAAADDDEPGARARRKGSRRRGRRGARGTDDDPATAPAEPARPLTAEERLQQALTLAYRHLSKRDRTVSEVRTHLEKREIDEASIVGALDELVAFGYVDDERYASRFVEDKRRLEGWGHLRIEQGLRRTGIPREIADRALADDPLRGEEDDLAVEALEQRLQGRALEDDRARQKALRLLATKGYALETAYAAVRTYERRSAERDAS